MFLTDRYVDDNADKFVSRLREAVAIPSVSAWPQNRKFIGDMVEWTKKVASAIQWHILALFFLFLIIFKAFGTLGIYLRID